MNVYPSLATSPRVGGISVWNTPYAIGSRMQSPLATFGPLGIQSPLASYNTTGMQAPHSLYGTMGMQSPLATCSPLGFQSPLASYGTMGMGFGNDIQCIIQDVLTDRIRDMRNDALLTELLDHRRLNRNIDDVIADISAGCYVHPQEVAQALIADTADNLATDVAINAVISDRMYNRKNDRGMIFLGMPLFVWLQIRQLTPSPPSAHPPHSHRGSPHEGRPRPHRCRPADAPAKLRDRQHDPGPDLLYPPFLLLGRTPP
ncbi:hypothetical protein BDK51DRAFT_48756 [Blyttiomyces helicus]|uniref:Uncharacterized protein n=1 Tax=Blyttiomyces helicus TaxID=388810 RepID=A0A4P9W5W4_9FUNG|nr:hypothetical protein BDK51DRAFT_48756 [Blyttiomyces helicus]|eukprot:RKO87352.1 hypothetical protein BDK51DRAFT_48756 [Blyttiomyces helicus]